jgi:hypothetical protein
MSSQFEAVLQVWIRALKLSPQPTKAFHQERLDEELVELEQAKTIIEKLSEAADVEFTTLRARCNGHNIRELSRPLTFRHIAVYVYMLGKFTSRCALYRAAGALSSATKQINELTNPSKDWKLAAVADRHREQLDAHKFVAMAKILRRIWPLLP